MIEWNLPLLFSLALACFNHCPLQHDETALAAFTWMAREGSLCGGLSTAVVLGAHSVKLRGDAGRETSSF